MVYGLERTKKMVGEWKLFLAFDDYDDDCDITSVSAPLRLWPFSRTGARGTWCLPENIVAEAGSHILQILILAHMLIGFCHDHYWTAFLFSGISHSTIFSAPTQTFGRFLLTDWETLCSALMDSLMDNIRHRSAEAMSNIIIGPESDHWQCLSLTDSLTDSLTPV